MMMQADERRQTPRVDLDVFLEETYFCGRQLGRTMDISEAGIRYLTGLTAGPRTTGEVFLELNLPDSEAPIQALGRIVGEMDGQLFRTTSVSFTSIKQDDADRIRSYVSTKLTA